MNTNDTAVKAWQEAEALKRFSLIAPLLREDLDEVKRIMLRKQITEQNHISVRSLYRYEDSYRKAEFSGLKPANRGKCRSQQLPENFEELLSEAIQLRREVPRRSVKQIITILELEQRVSPGVLKRSTLERHLHQAGFGAKQMQMYLEARQSSSKRFCKPHRMMLLQGDIKYGPALPIGKNGAMVKTYLSSAIDDHSRFVLASRFYDTQEESIVEDTFRTVIMRSGKFDACYFDNGSQYIARQLKFSLARLGIRVAHAPVRSGKSKGKIEKFHQVVDAFIREAKLKKVRTLEELNALWSVYLDEYYHKDSHAGIAEYYASMGVEIPPEGITPLQEFNRDTRPLTFLDVSVVAEAFLHHENRKVDKGGCISFRGRKYETKPALIGHTVEISYDPVSPDTLTIRYPGIVPFTATQLQISSYCSQEQAIPASMLPVQPETSRLLDALEKKHQESKERLADAISYASLRKEEQSHV